MPVNTPRSHGLDPGSATFAPLRTVDAEKSDVVLDVCILAQNILDPLSSSGVTSWYTGCALANAGHKITVLDVLGSYSGHELSSDRINYYRENGIHLVPCPEPEISNGEGPLGRITAAAYRTYEWSRRQQFDVMHVTETQGAAYFCLLAKQLGIAFHDTLFCVKASTPILRERLSTAQPISSIDVLGGIFMERKCVELADAVVSDSEDLLRWMRHHGYQLPKSNCYIQPNFIPPSKSIAIKGGTRRSVCEIVFFGRLEWPKEVQFFCEALDQLAESCEADGGASWKSIEVTFLGRKGQSFDAENFINEQSRNWPFPCNVETGLGRSATIEYLAGEGRLVVIPSLIENCTWAIYECLRLGIPFLAGAVGPPSELVDQRDHEFVLFEGRPADLARKLENALCSEAVVARSSFSFECNYEDWLQWHRKVPALKALNAKPDSRETVHEHPLVSVCIVHYNRPRELDRALNSIVSQTYSNLEIFVVDDGSTSVEAKEYLARKDKEWISTEWHILRQENRYPGAARNRAARYANGKYLFFMDDDDLAKPCEIERLVQIAEYSDADVLTCFADVFDENETEGLPVQAKLRLTPLGDAVSLGLFRNGFGHNNVLFKISSFWSIDGYTEDYRVGKEDHELFARAVLRGLKLHLVPEALFWYRQSTTRIRDKHETWFAGSLRVARPYVRSMPACFEDLIYYAQGVEHERGMERRALRAARVEIKQMRAKYRRQGMRIVDSKSYALGRVFRTAGRALGLEIREYSRSDVERSLDPEAIVQEIVESPSWELLGPWRALSRLVQKRLWIRFIRRS